MPSDADDRSPAGAGRAIWDAIRACVRALPADRRSVGEVEGLFRRLADQAFRELREEVEQEVMRAAFAELDEAAAEPGAAPDRGGISVFQSLTSHRPPR